MDKWVLALGSELREGTQKEQKILCSLWTRWVCSHRAALDRELVFRKEQDWTESGVPSAKAEVEAMMLDKRMGHRSELLICIEDGGGIRRKKNTHKKKPKTKTPKHKPIPLSSRSQKTSLETEEK